MDFFLIECIIPSNTCWLKTFWGWLFPNIFSLFEFGKIFSLILRNIFYFHFFLRDISDKKSILISKKLFSDWDEKKWILNFIPFQKKLLIFLEMQGDLFFEIGIFELYFTLWESRVLFLINSRGMGQHLIFYCFSSNYCEFQ